MPLCITVKGGLIGLDRAINAQQSLFESTSGTIKDTATNIKNKIDEYGNQINEQIDQVTQKLKEYNGKFSELLGEQDKHLTKIYSDAQTTINDVEQKFQQAQKEATEQITKSALQLVDKGKEAIGLMDQQTTEEITTFKTKVNNLQKQIADESGKYMQDVKNVYANVSAAMTEMQGLIHSFQQEEEDCHNIICQCDAQLKGIDTIVHNTNACDLDQHIQNIKYQCETKKDFLKQCDGKIDDLQVKWNDTHQNSLKERQEQMDSRIQETQSTINKLRLPDYDQPQNQNIAHQYEDNLTQANTGLGKLKYDLQTILNKKNQLCDDYSRKLSEFYTSLEYTKKNKVKNEQRPKEFSISQIQCEQLEKRNFEIVDCFLERYKNYPCFAKIFEHYILYDSQTKNIQKKIEIASKLHNDQKSILDNLTHLQQSAKQIYDQLNNRTIIQHKELVNSYIQQYKKYFLTDEHQRQIKEIEAEIDVYTTNFNIRRQHIMRVRE